MSELQATVSQKQPRSAVAGTESLVQTFVIYGAFLLIAAIVFGTLSFRPF